MGVPNLGLCAALNVAHAGLDTAGPEHKSAVYHLNAADVELHELAGRSAEELVRTEDASNSPSSPRRFLSHRGLWSATWP